MNTAALVAEGEKKVPDDIGVACIERLPYSKPELTHSGISRLKIVKDNRSLHTYTGLSTCLNCKRMQQQLSGEKQIIIRLKGDNKK